MHLLATSALTNRGEWGAEVCLICDRYYDKLPLDLLCCALRQWRRPLATEFHRYKIKSEIEA